MVRLGLDSSGGYQLNEVIDISLLSLASLGVLEPKDPRMITIASVVREELWLKTSIEGCARYQGDVYQRTEDSPKDIPGNTHDLFPHSGSQNMLWIKRRISRSFKRPFPILNGAEKMRCPPSCSPSRFILSTVPLLPGVILLQCGPSCDTEKAKTFP